MLTIVLMILGGLSAAAQTQIDLRSQAKGVDFSATPSTKPAKTGTVLPAACSAGELFFKTDAPPGSNLYGCGAANSWTVQGGFTDSLENGIVFRSGSGASPANANQLSAPFFCEDNGTSSAYACDLNPAVASYTKGTVYWFKAKTTNSGPATINFNGLGPKAIVKAAGTPMAPGDLQAGQWAMLTYDGVTMQMLNALGSSGAVSSIFGRGGAVSAQTGDYTTAQVTESGNLYFSDQRALAAVRWDTLTGKPAAFPPSGHAAGHQNGGSDEIATSNPAPYAIPKADSSGRLSGGWVDVPSSLGYTPENLAKKGQPGGYAGLDANGVVQAAQLPSAPPHHASSHRDSGADPVTLAAAQITSGTLAAAQGGLGTDASAWSGVVKMSGGTASAVNGAANDCVRVDGASGPCAAPTRSGTVLPPSCAPGDLFLKTDAQANSDLYVCGGINTWIVRERPNMTVKVDDWTVGASNSLNFVTGSGMVTIVSGDPTQLNIQSSLDLAVVQTQAGEQSGAALLCATAGGFSRDYRCAMNPTIGRYTAGMVLHWRPDVNGAGGPTTLNVDTLGSVPVKLSDGATDPAATDIVAGGLYEIAYDGSRFRLFGSGSGGNLPANADQLSALFSCEDNGTGSAYACNLSPALASYTKGTVSWFKANTTNSGPATINFNGLGPKAIVNAAGTPIGSGDIQAGQWVMLTYNGVTMQMLNALGPSGVVSSIFGRGGAVSAQTGDYTTAQVTESGNLYFSDQRALAAVRWDTLTGKPAAFPPNGHATSHRSGGSDEIATAVPAANAIPKADSSGKLNGAWLDIAGALGFAAENSASKGQPNGYAGLDAGGRVPAAQLPAAPPSHASSHGNGAGDPVALGAQQITSGALAATRGGLGTDASGLSGVMKMSAGTAATVSGTATDCVRVDGTSAPCSASSGIDSLTMRLSEEFMAIPVTPSVPGTYTSSYNWGLSGTGTAAGGYSGVGILYGAVGLSAANGFTALYLGGYAGGTNWTPNPTNDTNWEFQFAFLTDNYNTAQNIVIVGLTDSTSQVPANGLYLRYNNNTGCTNTGSDSGWQFVSRRGGSETVTGVGVSIATARRVRVRIRSSQVGHVLFSVCESSTTSGCSWSAETDVATNLPNVSLDPVFAVTACSAAARSIYADRFDAAITRKY